MPTLANHSARAFHKLLVVGDSKVGKTSSLVSLIEAGYNLRILDMDNLLDPLVSLVRQRCPDRLDSVEYRTIRDTYRMTNGGCTIDGRPKAFIEAAKMIEHWTYDYDGKTIDLGAPSTWGPSCILVLDSLSRFCDAAYDWAAAMAPRGKSGDYDGRAVYGSAQSECENILATITSNTFETNVIVICHGQYIELDDGSARIFPQSVGQKLSPKVPQYFPAYVRYINQGGKRTIQLKSNPMIDLANPDPANLPDMLPAETGLATIFGAATSAAPPQPKPILAIRRLPK